MLLLAEASAAAAGLQPAAALEVLHVLLPMAKLRLATAAVAEPRRQRQLVALLVPAAPFLLSLQCKQMPRCYLCPCRTAGEARQGDLSVNFTWDAIRSALPVPTLPLPDQQVHRSSQPVHKPLLVVLGMQLQLALQVPRPGGRDVHSGHAADVQMMANAGEAGTHQGVWEKKDQENAASSSSPSFIARLVLLAVLTCNPSHSAASQWAPPRDDALEPAAKPNGSRRAAGGQRHGPGPAHTREAAPVRAAAGTRGP